MNGAQAGLLDEIQRELLESVGLRGLLFAWMGSSKGARGPLVLQRQARVLRVIV